MPNPYVNKVVRSNGTTLIDISDTTAVAADVASGKYFYLATGEKVAGSGSGGNSGYTRTVIVPQQTVTASGNAWALVSSDANIVEGDEYIVTVNGVEKISTATKNGSINYISFIDWDWDSGGYAFGTEQSYSGVYFRAKTDGTYTVKVEKLELNGSGGGGGSATLITKTITANGTYSASDDSADGYSSVTVNVPSSAASSWTKVAETTYQVSTTSTSASTVATWATGHSEIWTSDKIVYVRVRDTAGKRAGYFYGSDNFLVNVIPLLGTTTSTATMVRYAITYTSDSKYRVIASNGTTGYGVYAETVYNDGRLRIRQRYHSNSSLTIDGTYKVEVYLLDPAGGVPIFE
jgi:hypothetical protein